MEETQLVPFPPLSTHTNTRFRVAHPQRLNLPLSLSHMSLAPALTRVHHNRRERETLPFRCPFRFVERYVKPQERKRERRKKEEEVNSDFVFSMDSRRGRGEKGREEGPSMSNTKRNRPNARRHVHSLKLPAYYK